MTVGERIRHARQALNLHQVDLAEAVGVSIESISQLERGVTKDIPIAKIEGLAKILRSSPCWLAFGINPLSLGKTPSLDIETVTSIVVVLAEELQKRNRTISPKKWGLLVKRACEDAERDGSVSQRGLKGLLDIIFNK